MWTFDIHSGLGYFVGLSLILGSLGVFLTRLITGSEAASHEILKDIEKKAVADREKALDDLDKKLADDGDPRTEACLRDLRQLAELVQDDETWNKGIDSRTTFDIVSGVENMFQQCVASLEKTLELWYTANRMTTQDARRPILAERERIVVEVGKSITQLGRIIAEIKVLKTENISGVSDLARIRDELNQSLNVAKSVEARMQTLEREISQKEE